MLRRVKLIYNPLSGENVITEYLDQIIELYQKHDFLVVPYRLAFDRPQEEIIYDMAEGYHHVLIAGGDGTVNHVVNLLKNANIDIPVGVLPTGTANDFATMLGMPADIMDACRKIVTGSERRIDLGRVNGMWYVNVFSCGLFTDISQKTPTIIKNNFGKIAYYINGLGELPRFRKMNLSIHTDGGDYEGDTIIFFVFNGRTAGNLPIAYKAKIDDGKLDVLIVKGDTPLRALRAALKYINRLIYRLLRRKGYPSGIVHLRCTKLTAISARPETTDIDGQPGPQFPIEISCEAGALRVICGTPEEK